MIGMKEFPDKYFDLAIVDPPYGNGGVNTDWDNKKTEDLEGGLKTTKSKEQAEDTPKNMVIK